MQFKNQQLTATRKVELRTSTKWRQRRDSLTKSLLKLTEKDKDQTDKPEFISVLHLLDTGDLYEVLFYLLDIKRE